MKLREIARLCGAGHRLNESLADSEPTGVTIDSRSIQPGGLFVAVPGTSTDGHKFVGQVFEKGAAAALVVHHRLPSAASLGEFADRLLFVENTVCSLQQLAHRVITTWNRPVIGITGSAGKTTIKDLTAHVLGAAGRTLKSPGNLNTTYGLPLTITQMITKGVEPDDFDYAVFEMGMSSFGEIARLVDIAPPEVGVVGNVGTAHFEFFGSSDAIARAKSELIDGIKPRGVAVLNADDARVVAMGARRTDVTHIGFGIDSETDVMAKEIREAADLSGTRFTLVTPRDSADVTIALLGRHSVANALAAAAVGYHFGLRATEIAAALESAARPEMRGEVLRFANGITVVDDSYNSNPEALREAVRMIAGASAFRRRILVAGEMLELGPQAAEFHRASGNEIAAAGIDLVLGVRGLARELVDAVSGTGSDAVFFETTEAAADALIERVQDGDVILVKGSRGVGTERIVERLKLEFGPGESG